MTLRLFGSTTSPYVRKVRVVLAEKGLDYSLITDDIWANDAQISCFNPLGKVPCLVADDGQGIYDSRVIVAWLEAQKPAPQLMPPAQRLEILRWEALADGLLDAAILIRLEQVWPGRSPAERSAAWMAWQQKKIDAALAAMEQALGDRRWCVDGASMTLADVATGCALAYLDFRFDELAWRKRHPRLGQLLDERLAPRVSFADTPLG